MVAQTAGDRCGIAGNGRVKQTRMAVDRSYLGDFYSRGWRAWNRRVREAYASPLPVVSSLSLSCLLFKQASSLAVRFASLRGLSGSSAMSLGSLGGQSERDRGQTRTVGRRSEGDSALGRRGRGQTGSVGRRSGRNRAQSRWERGQARTVGGRPEWDRAQSGRDRGRNGSGDGRADASKQHGHREAERCPWERRSPNRQRAAAAD